MERFIQSLRVEYLDRFVIVAKKHENYIFQEWRLHYNRERPHEARGQLPPSLETAPVAAETIRIKDVIFSSRLSGLLNSCSRRAA